MISKTIFIYFLFRMIALVFYFLRVKNKTRPSESFRRPLLYTEKEMNKRRSILEQWIIVFSLIVFPAALFIMIPDRPINSFDFHVDYFIDKYLFGNGYYS